jgi:hypothetical protein
MLPPKRLIKSGKQDLAAQQQSMKVTHFASNEQFLLFGNAATGTMASTMGR